MTEEEMLEKFGEIELYFTHYYKYMFSFRATADNGYKLYGNIGGDGGDIYKLEVCNDSPIKVKDFEKEFDYFSISDSNEVDIFEYNTKREY